MAVPKSKWSKARSRSRRANYKISAPNLAACPQCHELRMPHRVCRNCGHYDGRQVVEVSDEA